MAGAHGRIGPSQPAGQEHAYALEHQRYRTRVGSGEPALPPVAAAIASGDEAESEVDAVYQGKGFGLTSAANPGATIRAAIRRRLLLQFHYDGHPRVVAPYCYGVSTRGVDSLRAVQIRGSSASNAMGFGKLWTVSKLLDLRLLDEPFIPDDPDYNPNDRGMKQIYCRIE